MSGAVGVMSVILLEVAVGGIAIAYATGVWGHVRRGFFLLSGILLALCGVGAWALVNGLVEDAPALIAAQEQQVADGVLQLTDPALVALAGTAGSRAALTVGVFAALLVLWQLLLLARQDRVAHWIGLTAIAAGVVALVALGLVRQPDPLLGILELVLGAVFLGSAWHGLLLGHWYLVERRLSNVYMVRSASWYVGGVVAAFGAVALSATNAGDGATGAGLNPLLASSATFSVLLGIGLVAVCALIAGFAWKLSTEGGRSIQAATGMFYLAVIMAFAAELSTKFRFF